MRTVRVFISSPSDAIHERDRLSRVCQRLNILYGAVVRLEIIRWEDDFYRAHETFQTQIPEAKTCDIVIGILKHRLGSPLPSSFPRMPEADPFLGEPYPSGTAYEILSSIASRLLDGNDKPDIYVFRDAEPPVVSLGSTEVERVGSEWRRLEDFARRFFFTAEGDFRFAFQTFRSATQFEQQIDALLRKWIESNLFADRRSTWPVETRGSPFRALDVFDYGHRDVFFGRDRETARIIDLFADLAHEAGIEGSRRLPFVLVTGASGAGKSSLLRAGLVPTLAASDAANTEQWRVAVMTPSVGSIGPFRALAAALLGPAFGSSESSDDRPPGLPEIGTGPFSTEETLGMLLAHGDASGVLPVVEALDRVEKAIAVRERFEQQPTVRLLLVVDQLDEVFSTELAPEARAAFGRLLAALARTGKVWIAATLRTGLYEHLLADPEFFALRDLGAMFELGAPGEIERAEMVRKPAQAADIVFEKDPVSGQTLDEVLLADFDRPDMLPLLQFTLEALFLRCRSSHGVITFTYAAYRSMNGIAGAVETAAAQALENAGPIRRAKLPKLFRKLVAASGTIDGDQVPLVLRDVPASEFGDDTDLLGLADALTEARLLVSTGTNGEGRAFRLAHQRLLSLWPDAEAAIRDSATFFRVQDELRRACTRWLANGRKSGQLIRDPILLAEADRLARSYTDEVAPERLDYLRRSKARARLGTTMLGATAILFAGLFAGAIWFYDRAQRAERAAVEEQARAEANFALARDTLQGVVSDIADGLKNIEGMTIAGRRAILSRVSASVEMLKFQAGDSHAMDETRVMTLNATADAYAAGGDTDAAIATYRQMIDLNRDILARSPQEGSFQVERGIGVALERIGDLLVIKGEREAALKVFEECLEIRRDLLKRHPGDVTLQRDLSVSIDRLGQQRQSVGDLDGAARIFLEGADASRARIADHPDDRQALRDLSVSLEHISDIELMRGDTKKAQQAITESLTIRQKLAHAAPEDTQAAVDLSVGLMKEADLARVAGDAARALTVTQKNLALIDRLLRQDPDRVDWLRQRSILLNGIGDLAVGDGRLDDASRQFDEALATLEKASAKAPADTLVKTDLTITLNRQGDLLLKRGEADKALSRYQQGLDIVRSLLAVEPARPELRRNLAFGLGRISDAQAALNRLDEAKQNLAEALAIGEDLMKQAPATVAWRNDMVVNSRKMGDLEFRSGKADAAVDHYRRSADLLRQVIKEGMATGAMERDLSVTLNKLGDALLTLGQIEPGSEAYDESLAVIDRLSAATPSDANLKRDVAYTLGRAASGKARLGKLDDAKTLAERASSIAADLARAQPSDIRAQTDLAYTLIGLSSLQDKVAATESLKQATAVLDRLQEANPAAGGQEQLRQMIKAAENRL